MNERYRVLVVDDDASIRETYRHILQPPASEVGGLEALVSGATAETGADIAFAVTAAAQGEEAAVLLDAAARTGTPFQLAFIDMRMPPGWDGMRTAVALRALDPSIYIVISTAFSDYDVNALQAALGHDVVLLRKPFNQEEVFQLARTLCQSWRTRRRLEAVTAELENRVGEHSAELDRRMTQQQVLIDIAARFIELDSEDSIDDAVDWSLARIGKVIDADACALYQFDARTDSFSLGHEWVALGVKPLRTWLPALPRAGIKPAYARFLRGESFAFERLADLPQEMAALRADLSGRIESCLAVPVEIGGRLTGIFAIGHIQVGHDRDRRHEQLLRTAGHVVVRALEAHAATRALIEKQELLRATERAARIGNWSLEAGAEHIDWDEEVRRIVGIDAQSVVDRELVASLVHPDDLPALRASIATSFERGTPYRIEYRIRRPDGEQRWVACWAEPHRDVDGRVARLVGMMQDISERRMREEHLKLLSEAVEQSPASVVITDVRGGIEYVNQRFTEVTGYSREEAIGRNPSILKSGFTPDETYATLWRTILDGGIWRGELLNRRKNGELYLESATIQGMRDGHGRLTHLLAVKEDISERRRAEAELLASERKYRAIVETADEGIWQVDADWNTTFVNRRMEELLGHAPGAMLGRPLGNFMDAAGRELLGALQAQCERGVREHHDFVFVRADGGELHALVSATPILDERGGFLGATALVADISRRKRLESTLVATAEFVSRVSGEHYCQDLVRHAAQTLRLDYVHVGRLDAARDRIEVQATWLDGEWLPDWSYALADTPCRDTIDAARMLITAGVQTLYPRDEDLKKVAAESYVGEPVFDAAGRVVGLIVGIGHTPMPEGDIVQANLRILAVSAAAYWAKLEATRALRSEHDASRNILRTVEAIIVALDRDGRITLINRKGCDLLGYREDELLGEDWFATCLPQGPVLEEVRAVFRKALAADMTAAEYFENPVRTRAGEERMIAWHNSIIRDAEGGVIGGLSTGIDITEERLATLALHESEGRFRKLIELIPNVAVQGYAPDGTVRYWNHASETLYGYSAREAVGANLVDLIIPPPMRDAVRRAVRDMVASGQGAPAAELLLLHKDGSPVPVYTSHVVIKGADGETQLYSLDVDLSDHQHLLARLREAKNSQDAG